MEFGNYNTELGPDPNPPTSPVRVRDDDKIYHWVKQQKGLNLQLSSRQAFINTMQGINNKNKQ